MITASPQIVSCKEAKQQGLKRYFTGKPCKRGHVVERYVANAQCGACLSEDYKAGHPPEVERERSRQRRAADPRKFIQYCRDYRDGNRDALNAGARRRHKENPQKAKDKAARLNAADPTRQSRYDRAHYLRHGAKRRAAAQKWRDENPERARLQNAAWVAANPEKARAKCHRRRARLAGVGGSYTEEDVDRIYRMQKGKCAYCRAPLKERFQIDHVMPIAANGTNHARNIQLTCHKGKGGGCNQRKRDKDPIDFARSLGLLV